MKYKEIINSTQEELEKKYPWLKSANFKNAVIEDGGEYVIWKDGVWKGGVWKYGIWEDGIWEGERRKDGVWKYGTWEGGRWYSGTWKGGIWKGGRWYSGIWEGGIWKGGIWEKGEMWSNIDQQFHEVVYQDNKFINLNNKTNDK